MTPSVSEGMQRAHGMRQEWLNTLASRETTFAYVVELSKTEDGKALSRLRLLKILAAVSGWTERSATEALSHYGIGPKDTIQSIRRNKDKIEALDRLLKANPKLWRPRPAFPEGWPFVGKLTYLYEQQEQIDIPEELLSLLDDEDEPSHEEAPVSDDDSSFDELESLLGDD